MRAGGRLLVFWAVSYALCAAILGNFSFLVQFRRTMITWFNTQTAISTQRNDFLNVFPLFSQTMFRVYPPIGMYSNDF